MKVSVFPSGAYLTNCYAAYDDNGNTVIIDPGAYSDELISFISQNCLNVTHIVLTHGHADHICGAEQLRSLTNAKIAIHTLDAPRLKSSKACLADDCGYAFSPFTPDILLNDGDVLTVGDMVYNVMHTPGHSEGSICLLENKERVIFSGDTLFYTTIGRTDFKGGNHSDMIESLKALYRLDGDYSVYPGHERSTTLQRERERNFYMRKLG